MVELEFNDGASYAQVLETQIRAAEESVSPEERAPEPLLKAWIEGVKKQADENWIAYLKGDIDSYLLDEQQLRDLYDKAVESFVGELLEGLVDKGMLDMHISPEGEILYGLSEEGKEFVEKNKE